MNEENPQIDIELEARIVALVLGEASDFERDQLNQLMAERPELAALKAHFESIHGLLCDVGAGEPATEGEEWKLSPDRRNAVLAAIRGDAASSSPSPASLVTPRVRAIRHRRLFWSLASVAAVFFVVGYFALFARLQEASMRGGTRRQLGLASSSPAANSASPSMFGETHSFSLGNKSIESGQPIAKGMEGVKADFGREATASLSAIQDSLQADVTLPTPYYLYDDTQRFDGLSDKESASRSTRSTEETTPDELLALNDFDTQVPSNRYAEGAMLSKNPEILSVPAQSKLYYFGTRSPETADAAATETPATPALEHFAEGELGARIAKLRSEVDKDFLSDNAISEYALKQQTQELPQVALQSVPSPDISALALDDRRFGQVRVAEQLRAAEMEALDMDADAGLEQLNGTSATPWMALPSVTLEDSNKPGDAIASDGETRGQNTRGSNGGQASADVADGAFYYERPGMAGGRQIPKEAMSELQSSAGAVVQRRADGFEGDDVSGNRPALGFAFGLERPGSAESDENLLARGIDSKKRVAERDEAEVRPGIDKWGSKSDSSELFEDEESSIPSGSKNKEIGDNQATVGKGGRDFTRQQGLSAEGSLSFAGDAASNEARYRSYALSDLARTSESLRTSPRGRVAVPSGLDEVSTESQAFSTFSLHVSDVSFKLAQAALAKGEWPEASRVRIEEFVNAFDYGDPLPRSQEKVACQIEQSSHPFLQQRNLMRVSMRTAAVGRANNTPLRLTFLLDNSGSMERMDRQETVRRAFALLAEQLTPMDQVTLISFARQPRLLADKVSGARSKQLVELIDQLPSEGGTNIESALQLAFEKAREQQVGNAQNRIVLLTDGAVNLGDANPESLSQMITSMRDAGIAFDAAGIGAEGLNDEILEALTRQGDGRYYLLDSAEAADDGFVRQIAGALRPSAKNVKVQVEFNPKRVARYKLLGFEKHLLNKEDFRNDQVDAAEMAAEEAGVAVYQFEVNPDGEGDVGSVSVRFRDLSSGHMIENRWPIPYESNAPRLDQAEPSLRIASAAALLAAKLRGDALGETVDLKALSSLLSEMPSRSQQATRVQQLQTMIAQARQILGR